MKLLFDATCIINEPTGAGNFALRVLESLAALQKKEDSLHILVRADLDEHHPIFAVEASKEPVTISSIGLMRDFKLSLFLWKNRKKYDLFFCFLPYLPFFYTLPNSAIVIHDLGYLSYPEFFKTRLHKWYFMLTLNRSITRSNRIFTVSEASKKDIQRFFGHKVPITVAYEDSNVDFTSVPEPYALKRERPFLLFVGERRPHKNIVRMLEAFAEFKKHDTNQTDFILVGRDYNKYTTVLTKKITELGIGGNIHIYNSVTDTELISLYTQAKALILVSLYEGFGLPILEAMRARVPVITSNVYSMPEVAGDAALLVDPTNVGDIAEKIGWVLRNEEFEMKGEKLKVSDLVRRGQVQASKFSWHKSAQIIYTALHSSSVINH